MKNLIPVILAAGESRRMKSPKPYMPIGGKTFLEKIANDIREAGISARVVIVFNESHKELINKVRLPDFMLIPNGRQELGQIYSLQLALAHLPLKCSGALVCLTDHPFVCSDTYRQITAAHMIAPKKIIIPLCQGRRGHPAIFPQHLFSEILALSPAQEGGMRNILQIHSDLILEIPTEDEGILADLDTPEDLARHNLT